MKRISVLLIILGILILSCTTEPKAPDTPPRPNIVVIMADDMGYSDLGLFGSGIETPNLDALAQEGLLMTQFYNSGRCCPSRASLLTGVYQHEAGVGDMSSSRGVPSYQGYLNRRVVTVAELLGEAGYRTMISGKWHVGGKPDQWPLKRGFDRFFGFPRGGGIYFYPFRPGRSLILDSMEIHMDPGTFYSTDAINDYACTFIEEANDTGKPFFLYIAHIAPHFPLQAWPEDIEKYRGKFKNGFNTNRDRRYDLMHSLGLIEENTQLSDPDELVKNWELLSPQEQDTFDLRMSVYAAQLDRMDQGLGKVFDKLRELGEWDDTLILFLSDNGASPEDPRGWLVDKGPLGSSGCQQGYLRSWANVSNTPFRLYKHWVHEGGISTPLIAHWPRVIPQQRVDYQVGHIMDIMATCLEVAGIDYPATRDGTELVPLRGKSLVPIFRNQIRKGHDILFWEHEGNRAARKGKWKIVSAYPENVWRLYDMASDRAEQNNLAGRHPEIYEELIREYDQWADRTGVVSWDQLITRQPE